MESRYLKVILTAIALLLAVIAVQPREWPPVVRAQSGGLYLEPGYAMIRSPDGFTQVKGKIVVNLGNGEIWGFPTLVDGPYPVGLAGSKPPVSKPIFLGTFDFSAMQHAR